MSNQRRVQPKHIKWNRIVVNQNDVTTTQIYNLKENQKLASPPIPTRILHPKISINEEKIVNEEQNKIIGIQFQYFEQDQPNKQEGKTEENSTNNENTNLIDKFYENISSDSFNENNF